MNGYYSARRVCNAVGVLYIPKHQLPRISPVAGRSQPDPRNSGWRRYLADQATVRWEPKGQYIQTLTVKSGRVAFFLVREAQERVGRRPRGFVGHVGAVFTAALRSVAAQILLSIVFRIAPEIVAEVILSHVLRATLRSVATQTVVLSAFGRAYVLIDVALFLVGGGTGGTLRRCVRRQHKL